MNPTKYMVYQHGTHPPCNWIIVKVIGTRRANNDRVNSNYGLRKLERSGAIWEGAFNEAFRLADKLRREQFPNVQASKEA